MSGTQYDECLPISLAGAAAIGKNKFVKLSASKTVAVCSGASDNPIGISVTDCLNAGDQIAVLPLVAGSVYKAVAGSGGVTYGNHLILDSTGQALVAVTPAAAGTNLKNVIGRALESASATATFEFICEKQLYQA